MLYIWPKELYLINTPLGSQLQLNAFARVDNNPLKTLAFTQDVKFDVINAIGSINTHDKIKAGTVTKIARYNKTQTYDIDMKDLNEIVDNENSVYCQIGVAKMDPFLLRIITNYNESNRHYLMIEMESISYSKNMLGKAYYGNLSLLKSSYTSPWGPI